jgi:hypothetical protein
MKKQVDYSVFNKKNQTGKHTLQSLGWDAIQLAENEYRSETKPADPWTVPFRIVLRRSSKPGEWVTHCESLKPDGSHVAYFWGHYFMPNENASLTPANVQKNLVSNMSAFELAFNDYKERCEKYGLNPFNTH